MEMMLAGLIGLILGVLIMFLISGGGDQKKDVQAVEEQLKDYQEKVESHFSKTADLIDNLTESYKQVFEHLSESAETLLDDEQIQRQIINRKQREVTLSYLSHKNETEEDNAEKTHNQPDPWAG